MQFSKYANWQINKFIINNWIAATLNSMMSTTAPRAVQFIKRNKKDAKPVDKK